jgi:hypothetical protein
MFLSFRKALALSILLAPFSALACSTCGCSASGGGAASLSGWGGHYLALSARLDRFDNGWQSPLGGEEILLRSFDDLFRMDLVGAWQPARRWQVLGGVPLRANHRHQGSALLARRGIGDAWLTGRYALWLPDGAGEDPAVGFLSLGLGLELPTGRFRPESAEDVLPVNNQLGSGSWDLVAELRGRWPVAARHALDLELRGQRNGTNAEAYRFGHQAAGSLLWRWTPAAAGPWTWSVSAGPSAERLGRDANGGFLRTDTGGGALLAEGGLRVSRGSATAALRYRQPLAQSYAGGQARLRQSLDLSLAWSFGTPFPTP